jgi:pimeloyl-ACP methyl ester carboxylesterase
MAEPQVQFSLYFTETGQGPNLVLLHGLGASGFSWRANLEPLGKHFHLLVPDLPGHGRSPAPLSADYRPEALVRELVHFLDCRGIRRTALAGNSLGGGLALLLARDYPQRVAALILIAPAAALTHIPYMFYPLRLPGLGLITASLLGSWFIPWFLRLVYHRRELITPEVVAGYGAPYRELTRRLVFRQFCRQMRVRPLEEIADLLGHVSQPTLLLWGAEDRILPVSQGYWLKEHLPQAELQVLPEVAHAPQEEAPEAVNKIMIDFLTRSFKN